MGDDFGANFIGSRGWRWGGDDDGQVCRLRRGETHEVKCTRCADGGVAGLAGLDQADDERVRHDVFIMDDGDRIRACAELVRGRGIGDQSVTREEGDFLRKGDCGGHAAVDGDVVDGLVGWQADELTPTLHLRQRHGT